MKMKRIKAKKVKEGKEKGITAKEKVKIKERVMKISNLASISCLSSPLRTYKMTTRQTDSMGRECPDRK